MGGWVWFNEFEQEDYRAQQADYQPMLSFSCSLYTLFPQPTSQIRALRRTVANGRYLVQNLHKGNPKSLQKRRLNEIPKSLRVHKENGFFAPGGMR